jgi:hypothetical protein
LCQVGRWTAPGMPVRERPRDYEWVAPYRKGMLDLAIDAHTALADPDPERAAQLLRPRAHHVTRCCPSSTVSTGGSRGCTGNG